MSFDKNAKALLSKLGIKAADLEKEEYDAEAGVETFKKQFIAVELKEELEKARLTGKTGALKEFGAKVGKKYGLDMSKYKDMKEGEFEAIIEDAANTAVEKYKEENPTADPKGDPKTVEELKNIKAMLEAANKENKTLKKTVDEFPTALEQAAQNAKKEIERGYASKSALSHIQGMFKEGFEDGYAEFKLQKEGYELDTDTDGEVIIFKKQPDGTRQQVKKAPNEFFKGKEGVLDLFAQNKWLNDANRKIVEKDNGSGAGSGIEKGKDYSHLPPEIRAELDV
jgi:regulator of replication initiation timing